MIEPLRISVDVACGTEHAFATWTERFGRWWPRGHERLGTEGLAWRDANAGGWNGLLPHFITACKERAS